MSDMTRRAAEVTAALGVELKPCPFCGEDAAKVVQVIKRKGVNNALGDDSRFTVMCDHCGAKTPDVMLEASAKVLWNARAALASPPGAPVAIDMVLFCPRCHRQHIDAPDERTPDWTNPPHKSHLCHGCGFIWRPADVPTNGVVTTATHGANDTTASPTSPPAQEELTDGQIAEAGRRCGLWRLADLLDADQWNNIEPLLFKFARAMVKTEPNAAQARVDGGNERTSSTEPLKKSEPVAACHCAETYPQMVPGRLAHGPGCVHAAPIPPSEKERERLADHDFAQAYQRMWKKLDATDHYTLSVVMQAAKAATRQADAPVGWVSVPVEPTEAMLDAAFAAAVWPDLNRATSSDVIAALRANMVKEYRAFLAVTPRPAGSEG